MAEAKMTLIGLETYRQLNDASLFDDLTFPDGITKQDATDVILQECGEFETLYPDPDFLQASISLWGRKHYRTFEKWYEALQLEYDPIENYDRREEWTDTGTGTQTAEISSSGTNTGNSQSDNYVSSYDSDSLHQQDRNKTKTSDTTKTASTNNQQTTGETVHTGRVHGNIGVTTSQQMLQSELELATWNLYQQIADLFKLEFCVAVYY